jgi:uncharacterized protein (TIGR00251 family)
MKKTINVTVLPRSNKNEVTAIDHENYKIRLTVVPREGAANKKLIEMMSEFLDIPKSCIEIVKGHRSKKKILEIET